MKLLEKIFSGLLIIVCFLPIIFLEIGPVWPKTATGWIVMIIIVIPAYIIFGAAAEYFVEKIDDSQIGKSVAEETAGKNFSLLRIGFKLTGGLILLSVIFMIWLLIGDYFKPLGNFFATHFADW